MLRNSTALTMGIPRNECNSSKSLSPEILQEASAATANSRNLLSLGSRQTVMVSTGDKRNECERMHSIDSHLSRSEEHTSELQSRGHLVCRLLLEEQKS